ncbi:MAG: FAD-dependent oxidoreductase [Candidatus Bathyarchaeia archaeon]
MLGAGPAGLTAALYAARGKLKTLVVTGPMVGGQIALTNHVDNYPGFPDGVSGPELSDRFKAHAERFGAEFLDAEATKIDLASRPIRVWVGEKLLEAKALIVATGMTHKRLGVPGEDRLLGRGVFVCATCDAILYEDKKVVVVGGGDSAVRLRNLKTGEVSVEDADGVLLAIGWDPNTSILRGQLDLDELGYIKSDGIDSGKPGVFLAGDLIDRKYRQVATSCGSGCAAALEAITWLEGRPAE